MSKSPVVGGRYIKDGQVAVLYSPGYGAGWYTWSNSNDRTMLFDPGLVQLILDGAPFADLDDYASKRWPDEYLGGLRDVRIQWIPVGTVFHVHEYDGFESIRLVDDLDMIAA